VPADRACALIAAFCARCGNDCACRMRRFLVVTIPISGHCHVLSSCLLDVLDMETRISSRFCCGRLVRIPAHYAQIMFSVLEVIFRRNRVAAQSFGAGQFHIALIPSLGVLRGVCIRAAEPGGFGFLEPGVSRHGVCHILGLRARLCGPWFGFEGGIHGNPYAAAARAARRSFKGWSVRYNRRADRSAIENQPLRWDIELVQQGTERIPVDAGYVASRVGDFK
jgi:hypothetical protein